MPYDFIYIDGPTGRSGKNQVKCFNADLVNILLKLPADRTIDALLDQRITTYRALKKLIPQARIRYNPICKMSRISSASNKSLAAFLKDIVI